VQKNKMNKYFFLYLPFSNPLFFSKVEIFCASASRVKNNLREGPAFFTGGAAAILLFCGV